MAQEDQSSAGQFTGDSGVIMGLRQQLAAATPGSNEALNLQGGINEWVHQLSGLQAMNDTQSAQINRDSIPGSVTSRPVNLTPSSSSPSASPAATIFAPIALPSPDNFAAWVFQTPDSILNLIQKLQALSQLTLVIQTSAGKTVSATVTFSGQNATVYVVLPA